jgi:hypothetical protein
MFKAQSWDEAVHRRIVRDTPRFKGTRVPLMGGEAEPGLAPQAYLIEQAPHWVLQPHFHRQYQFQLISAGSGQLGRNDVAPLLVHYASPESGYGPITAGPKGLSYYTLRAVYEEGAHYLPESRELLRAGLKKHHAVSPRIEPGAADALRARTQLVVEETIPCTAEGMAVWTLRIPPDARFTPATLSGEGARYLYVAAGEMVANGKALPAGSVAFVHDEPGLVISASAAGLDLLILQFPCEATTRQGAAIEAAAGA